MLGVCVHWLCESALCSPPVQWAAEGISSPVVEWLSATILQFMIKAWKLAWVVSMGHLTRKLSAAIEISIWQPYFKIADILQRSSNIIVYLVLPTWRLAWTVSVGHLTRKLSEAIEISIWRPIRPYFKMADTLVQQSSNIIVYLVLPTWILAWAVSVGHLTRKLSEAIEISIWRPYFKMADTLEQQLSNIIVYLVLQTWKLACAFKN